nr:MAG TPA: hypothetical protein [Microviridae sp.]
MILNPPPHGRPQKSCHGHTRQTALPSILNPPTTQKCENYHK